MRPDNAKVNLRKMSKAAAKQNHRLEHLKWALIRPTCGVVSPGPWA